MSIEISNPNDIPFGILSNNAYTSLNIDGNIYSSVTNYIYANLLSKNDQNLFNSVNILTTKPNNLSWDEYDKKKNEIMFNAGIENYENKDFINTFGIYDLYEYYKQKNLYNLLKKSLMTGYQNLLDSYPQIKNVLMNTGNANIIYRNENTFAGVDNDNIGHNLVGKTLMHIRHLYLNEENKKRKIIEKEEENKKIYKIYKADIILKKYIEDGEYIDKFIHYDLDKIIKSYNNENINFMEKNDVIDLFNKKLLNPSVFYEYNHPGTLVRYNLKKGIYNLISNLRDKRKDIIFDTFIKYKLHQYKPEIKDNKEFIDLFDKQISIYPVFEKETKISMYSLKDRILNLYNLGQLSEGVKVKINENIEKIKMPSEKYIEKALSFYTKEDDDKTDRNDENNDESKYETKHEGKYESKYDGNDEGKYESKYDGNDEGKYESKYDGNDEGKYESKYDGNDEGKYESKYDGNDEGKYESKYDGNDEGKYESKYETKDKVKELLDYLENLKFSRKSDDIKPIKQKEIIIYTHNNPIKELDMLSPYYVYNNNLINIEGLTYPNIYYYTLIYILSNILYSKQNIIHNMIPIVFYKLGETISKTREYFLKDYGKEYNKSKKIYMDDFIYLDEANLKYISISKSNLEKVKLYYLNKGLLEKFKNKNRQYVLLSTYPKDIKYVDKYDEFLQTQTSKELMEIREQYKDILENNKNIIYINPKNLSNLILSNDILYDWIKSRIFNMCQSVYTIHEYEITKNKGNQLNEEFIKECVYNLFINCQSIYSNEFKYDKEETNVPQFIISLCSECPGIKTMSDEKYQKEINLLKREKKNLTDEEEDKYKKSFNNLKENKSPPSEFKKLLIEKNNNILNINQTNILKINQLKKKKKSSDLRLTSFSQIYWDYILIILSSINNISKNKNISLYTIIKFFISAQFLSLNSKKYPIILKNKNKLDNGIISALLNIINSIKGINNNIAKNTILTIHDINVAIAILLKKPFNSIHENIDKPDDTNIQQSYKQELIEFAKDIGFLENKKEDNDLSDDDSEDDSDDDVTEEDVFKNIDNTIIPQSIITISNKLTNKQIILNKLSQISNIEPNNTDNIVNRFFEAINYIKKYKMNKTIKLNRINFFADVNTL